MFDPETISTGWSTERRAALERWENEGGPEGGPPRANMPGSDLNALLAQEQTAIMCAEAATDQGSRDEQRAIARYTRSLVDLTPFPAREPHDFERAAARECGKLDNPGDFTTEFHALRRQVEEMENELALQFSEGKIGTKYNTFEHRSRVVRQARSRLRDLLESSAGPVSLHRDGSMSGNESPRSPMQSAEPIDGAGFPLVGASRPGEGKLPMGFCPLHDSVLVRRSPALEKTATAIDIRDASQEKPAEGEIIAVGQGTRSDDGNIRPLDVKAGDHILFGKRSGAELMLDGEGLVIMKESEIIGVVC